MNLVQSPLDIKEHDDSAYLSLENFIRFMGEVGGTLEDYNKDGAGMIRMWVLRMQSGREFYVVMLPTGIVEMVYKAPSG